MKVYLAGPMSGIPEHNFPAFRKATAELRSKGYEVVSPHEISEVLGIKGEGSDGSIDQKNCALCMRHDILALLNVDGMVVLPGWHNSKGAKAEVMIASLLGLPVFDTHDQRIHASIITTVIPSPQ